MISSGLSSSIRYSKFLFLSRNWVSVDFLSNPTPMIIQYNLNFYMQFLTYQEQSFLHSTHLSSKVY
jgi:hypothetical protein